MSEKTTKAAAGDRRSAGAATNAAEGADRVVPLRKGGGRCPICAKPAVQAYRPFCSKRCADIDLGRWLGEGYRIPTEEPADPNAPPERDESE